MKQPAKEQHESASREGRWAVALAMALGLAGSTFSMSRASDIPEPLGARAFSILGSRPGPTLGAARSGSPFAGPVGLAPILGSVNGPIAAQTIHIASILNQTSVPALTHAFPPRLTQVQLGERGLNWDVGQPLPGAFPVPAFMSPAVSDFDPSFHVPKDWAAKLAQPNQAWPDNWLGAPLPAEVSSGALMAN